MKPHFVADFPWASPLPLTRMNKPLLLLRGGVGSPPKVMNADRGTPMININQGFCFDPGFPLCGWPVFVEACSCPVRGALCARESQKEKKFHLTRSWWFVGGLVVWTLKCTWCHESLRVRTGLQTNNRFLGTVPFLGGLVSGFLRFPLRAESHRRMGWFEAALGRVPGLPGLWRIPPGLIWGSQTRPPTPMDSRGRRLRAPRRGAWAEGRMSASVQVGLRACVCFPPFFSP